MGVLDIDLRLPIAVLSGVFLLALGLRAYLGWAQRNDTRRTQKVLAALDRTAPAPEPKCPEAARDRAAEESGRDAHDG